MNVIKEFFGMKTGQGLLHDIKRIAIALEKIAELLKADYESRQSVACEEPHDLIRRDNDDA